MNDLKEIIELIELFIKTCKNLPQFIKDNREEIKQGFINLLKILLLAAIMIAIAIGFHWYTGPHSTELKPFYTPAEEAELLKKYAHLKPDVPIDLPNGKKYIYIPYTKNVPTPVKKFDFLIFLISLVRNGTWLLVLFFLVGFYLNYIICWHIFDFVRSSAYGPLEAVKNHKKKAEDNIEKVVFWIGLYIVDKFIMSYFNLIDNYPEEWSFAVFIFFALYILDYKQAKTKIEISINPPKFSIKEVEPKLSDYYLFKKGFHVDFFTFFFFLLIIISFVVWYFGLAVVPNPTYKVGP